MAEKAKCRVCGTEFDPCKGITGIPPEQQPFNWRKVCCSVPCGSQFINSILESRGLTKYGVPAEDPPTEDVVPEADSTEDIAAESPEPAPKPRRQRSPAQKPPEPEAEPTDAAVEDTE